MNVQFSRHHERKTSISPSSIFPRRPFFACKWKAVPGVCVCVRSRPRVTAHLALLVQRLYGERVGSYVNDHAQLEPVGGVGRPHWPPILHGLPVSARPHNWDRERQKGEEGET